MSNHKELYVKRRKAGLCVHCGQKSRLTKKNAVAARCHDCCDKEKARRAKRPKTYNRQALYRLNRKLTVLGYYSGQLYECACCRETEIRLLTIDHIYNGGCKHRRSIGTKHSSGQLYNWLLKHKFPAGFEVLCFNCNSGKGLFGKCPHQLQKLTKTSVETMPLPELLKILR